VERLASKEALPNLQSFLGSSLLANIPAKEYKVSTTSSSSLVIGPQRLCLLDQSGPGCV
jgi:hypothetical protein